MRGTKKKNLRAELRGIIGRGPAKAGEVVPAYSGMGRQVLVKDEFRAFKKVVRQLELDGVRSKRTESRE